MMAARAHTGFSRWQTLSGVKVVQQDMFVYSHRHRFAGAIDAVGVAVSLVSTSHSSSSSFVGVSFVSFLF